MDHGKGEYIWQCDWCSWCDMSWGTFYMKALNFNHIFGLKSVKKKEAVKFFAFTQDWAISTPVNQTPTCPCSSGKLLVASTFKIRGTTRSSPPVCTILCTDCLCKFKPQIIGNARSLPSVQLSGYLQLAVIVEYFWFQVASDNWQCRIWRFCIYYLSQMFASSYIWAFYHWLRWICDHWFTTCGRIWKFGLKLIVPAISIAALPPVANRQYEQMQCASFNPRR